MIPTFDIKVIPRSDAVQVANYRGRDAQRERYPFAPVLAQAAALRCNRSAIPARARLLLPILAGKTSRPLPAPSQRYNTLDFASKVVCQGDAVPVGFPATKPPVSLDSSVQEGMSPSFGIHPKSKNRMCEMITHILLCFSENSRKARSFSAIFLYWLQSSLSFFLQLQ